MPEEQTQETQQQNEDTTVTAEEGQEAKTLTQDEIDAIVENRLARERAKYSDYDDLKAKAERLSEIEDAQKTETERLTEKTETLTQKLTATEQEAAKLRVALRKGLTETQAKRLVGETEEELEEDADELLASFQQVEEEQGSGGPIRRTPHEKLKTGATSDVEGTQTPEELAASIRKARDGGLTL